MAATRAARRPPERGIRTTDPVAPGDEPDGTARDAPETGQAPGGAHWTAVGPREATAIVFIHGTRLTRAQWLPQLRRLSSRYRCIAVDLPGHGTRAGEAFSIPAAVSSVVAAIEAEAADGRALVVGLSLGGYVAIELAEAHPDRVRGLVLAGCSAEPVGPASVPFHGFAWLMSHVSPRVLRLVSLALFRARYRRPISEPIIRGGFWSTAGVVALRSLVGRRYLERVGRLWTPVTVVNGALDPVFGPGTEPWAHTARRGRSVIIPWALHLSNLDRPRTFSAVVAAAAEDALVYPAGPPTP